MRACTRPPLCSVSTSLGQSQNRSASQVFLSLSLRFRLDPSHLLHNTKAFIPIHSTKSNKTKTSKTHLQNLSRQPDRSLNPQVLALSSLQQLSADLLEGRDFSAGQGNSDLVDFLRQTLTLSLDYLFPGASFSCRHRKCGRRKTYWSFTTEVLLWLLVRHCWVGFEG